MPRAACLGGKGALIPKLGERSEKFHFEIDRSSFAMLKTKHLGPRHSATDPPSPHSRRSDTREPLHSIASSARGEPARRRSELGRVPQILIACATMQFLRC